MNDSSTATKANTVLKCEITVIKDGTGFSATYNPEVIPVTQYNTDIHFHIDAKSSDAVEIDSVGIKPDGQSQLIDQQISTNRQQFKVKDINTVKGNFVLSFKFRDKHGNQLAMLKASSRECDNGVDVPEIENNPPG